MRRVAAVSILLAIVASIGVTVYLKRGRQTIPDRRAELRELLAVQKAESASAVRRASNRGLRPHRVCSLS
jgi:hypothetical protein